MTPTTGAASEAEIAELRAAAEKATPGPWKAAVTIYEHMSCELRSTMPGYERGIAQVWDANGKGYVDAQFIALANPARVLSLLDQLATSQEREAALVAVLSEFSREYDGFEDGEGLPCPVLMKARALLPKASAPKEGETL